MTVFTLSWRNYRLELGKQTRIMGVLNITPDSFSDGGMFFDMDAAVRQGEAMAAAGADIIDIGGESTRPFAEEVDEAEEVRRVIPVIERLKQKIRIPISIDTVKSTVARRAVAAGAAIINDISALRGDPALAREAAKLGVPVILMHMKGTPKTMQMDPVYNDLIREVRSFLADAVDRAVSAGIPKSLLLIDPGIGFGKTASHNLCLIKRLHALNDLGVPLVVGTSRKRFIRQLLKNPSQKDMDPLSPLVETGTQASVAAAVLGGAHVVRVHDVASTRATLTVIDAIRNVPDTPS